MSALWLTNSAFFWGITIPLAVLAVSAIIVSCEIAFAPRREDLDD